MADEYVDLALLKAQITMKPGVADRNDLLQLALDAAHEDVNEYCGRRFDLTALQVREYDTTGRIVPGPYGDKLLVDDIGDLAGLVVETGSTGSWSVMAATGYAPRPTNAIARGRPVTGLLVAGGWWPTGFGQAAIRVTARWGWPAVPAKVKQATLLQAARLYARRNSPEGVLGSADWGAIRVSRIDPDVAAELAPFMLPGFGGGV